MKDHVLIDFSNYSHPDQNLKIEILNTSGQVIAEHPFKDVSGTIHRLNLNEDLSTGIYFVIIRSGLNLSTTRIFKQA